MVSIVPDSLEEYCEAHSFPEPTLLTELARETQARTAAPQMLVGHLEGAFLRLLARASGARRVLEIGTFTGYSALAMAEALPSDGRLITCDVDPEATEIARRYWARSPHGSKIELRLGPAIQTLKDLPGPFDLVFIDADKSNYLAYWEACVPKVRAGGLLAVDNVLWGGRVLEPREESDRAIAALNRRVREDARVEAVVLPLRDGVTVAWKK